MYHGEKRSRSPFDDGRGQSPGSPSQRPASYGPRYERGDSAGSPSQDRRPPFDSGRGGDYRPPSAGRGDDRRPPFDRAASQDRRPPFDRAASQDRRPPFDSGRGGDYRPPSGGRGDDRRPPFDRAPSQDRRPPFDSGRGGGSYPPPSDRDPRRSDEDRNRPHERPSPRYDDRGDARDRSPISESSNNSQPTSPGRFLSPTMNGASPAPRGPAPPPPSNARQYDSQRQSLFDAPQGNGRNSAAAQAPSRPRDGGGYGSTAAASVDGSFSGPSSSSAASRDGPALDKKVAAQLSASQLELAQTVLATVCPALEPAERDKFLSTLTKHIAMAVAGQL